MPVRKAIPASLTVTAVALAGGACGATHRRGNTAAPSTASPLTLTLSAPTHHPDCKQKWPVTVSARLGGRPAHATAYYEFLFGGQVVSRQYPFGRTPRNPHNHPYSFVGGFTDNTFGPFGSSAVGQPLTIRVVVRSGRYTAYASYNVTVVNVPGCKPAG